MNTLRTAQVCVIDDEPREYRRLLRALNSLRLGCVHVSGDKVEELPDTPFHNLRLVFLDMHLGTHGGMDARNVTAHTAAVFARVVSPDSAPIVVIVWTKFADYITSFRDSLFEARPIFRGRLFFIRMVKPQPPSKIDVSTLRQAIENELDQLAPLLLLWNWDALVQRAACGVTTELCRLASVQAQLAPTENEDDERRKMLSALNSVLRLLLNAEAGKALTKDAAASALLNVLGPLHSDRLENLAPKPELESAASLVDPGPAPTEPKQEVVVVLNTMLLTGTPNGEGHPLRPGTVYHVSDSVHFETATGLSVKDIAAELCQKSLLESQNSGRFATWLEACRPVLLEISPSCDFAQRKRPIARFVGGLMVPKGSVNQVKKRPDEGFSALRDLTEIKLPSLEPATDWVPVFSSAIVLSWPETKPAPFLVPLARLKEPVLADFRTWLSHQTARPGYLVVD
ncbi:MAG: hypothetical protein J0L84_01115 [Verrucomicrobia bacterium]|nr:hypothetical protein [Verrucomicrobiota bacterium]